MNSIDTSLVAAADQLFSTMRRRHLLDFYRVVEERRRQEKKWGPQTHPGGTSEGYASMAVLHRNRCDFNAKAGRGTWLDILLEEVYEAAAESDPEKLREELIQSAAVIFAWLEDLDRRESAQ